jgi:ribonuclease T1
VNSRRRITLALVGLVLLVVLGWLLKGWVGGSDLPVKPLSALPPEAARTWQLIKSHGPFPNKQDGVVFLNREKRLPAKDNGYYHEYTVATPGANDRGARRLITGSNSELYYTDDHYDSFVSVDPNR